MSDNLKLFGAKYTDQQKLRRRVFVSNYIINFDAKEACKIAGFSSPSFYKKLLKEPYTRELIRLQVNKLDKDNIISANEVRFMAKKEALDEELGTCTSRVSAIKLLHDITKDEVQENIETNIMLMPQVVPVDEWSTAAEKMQDQLKKRVKESNNDDDEH